MHRGHSERLNCSAGRLRTSQVNVALPLDLIPLGGRAGRSPALGALVSTGPEGRTKKSDMPSDTPSINLIVFAGFKRIAEGSTAEVLAQLRERKDHTPYLIFDAQTGESLDFDVHNQAGVVPHAASAEAHDDAPRGVGRPKLGVVAREVTLLPTPVVSGVVLIGEASLRPTVSANGRARRRARARSGCRSVAPRRRTVRGWLPRSRAGCPRWRS